MHLLRPGVLAQDYRARHIEARGSEGKQGSEGINGSKGKMRIKGNIRSKGREGKQQGQRRFPSDTTVSVRSGESRSTENWSVFSIQPTVTPKSFANSSNETFPSSVFAFISYSNARKKGQFLHFPIENRRKRGENRPGMVRTSYRTQSALALASQATIHLSQESAIVDYLDCL